MVVVLAALGLWWLVANRPIDTSTVGFWNRGEDTEATTTPDTSGGSNAGGVSVTSVNRPNTDVASIVNSLSSASRFNALFRSTGVAATIGKNSTSKYTIFVPTNGAFAQLPGGTIANLSSAEKLRLVQYHVVSGRAIDVDALTASTIEALSRDMLNFNYGTDKIPMVNSAIIVTEYTGKNGTVYLIDNVLLPPKKQTS